MNMQPLQDHFDVIGAEAPMRAAPPPVPVRSRIIASAISALIHVLILLGLLTAGNAVRVYQPPVVTVHIEPAKTKPEALSPPPSAPKLTRPSQVTAPIPEVDISTQPPSTLSAAPPAPPAPMASPPSPSHSNAVPDWQSRLLARLQEAKRYPESARFHHQQGVVSVRFTMDRDGLVLSSAIVKGSGFDVLDQEALALIMRAQPLPKPPAEVAGATIELVVPIEFYLDVRR
jgi:protein TonB